MHRIAKRCTPSYVEAVLEIGNTLISLGGGLGHGTLDADNVLACIMTQQETAFLRREVRPDPAG